MLILLAWIGSGCSVDAPVEPRPNFVFILADDLGWADVGYQGSVFHRTPHIDALAGRGLAFSDAYSASPVCSPSRAALLTGVSPARLLFTSVVDRETNAGPAGPVSTGPADERVWPPVSNDALAPGTPTIASILGARGYRTAMIGKWHIGSHPRDAGFDTFKGTVRAGRATSYFPPYFIRTIPDRSPGEYLTDRLTDEAIDFIEKSGTQPFFLYLSHFAPHLPFEGKPGLVASYEERVVPEAAQHNPVYAAMIESLDDSVGRIVATLERLELTQNTYVIFTSDNGGWEEMRPAFTDDGKAYHITSNLPLRSGKGRLYEGGVRVPLIISGPGVARPGRTCDEPVIGMDFLPTLSSLAGLTRDEYSGDAVLDGLDLAPLLEESGLFERDALYFHFPHQSQASSIRRGNRKLIHFYLTNRDEVYDLSTDGSEREDLAPGDPESVEEMRAALFAWLDECGASLPVRNPDFKRRR